MAQWRAYEVKPPFDGVYQVRAKDSEIISEHIVCDGFVYDSDGDEVINLCCEWRYVGALN